MSMSLHAFKYAADLHIYLSKYSLLWNGECNEQIEAHSAGNKNQNFQEYTNLGFGSNDDENARKCAVKCGATDGCKSFSMPYPKAFYHTHNPYRCVLYMVKCKERTPDDVNTGYWRTFTPGCFAEKCQEEWLDEQWALYLLLRRVLFCALFSHTVLFVVLPQAMWALTGLGEFKIYSDNVMGSHTCSPSLTVFLS